MTFLQFLNPHQGFELSSTGRFWKVEVTSVPEKFATKFMTTGPDIYSEPVAWVLVRLFRNQKQVLYPWVPIMQTEQWVVQPYSQGGGGGSVDMVVEEGVVATITREDN